MKSVTKFFYYVLYTALLLSFSGITKASERDDNIFSSKTDSRISEISGEFLNKPYQAEPLGEGSNGKFNQEPLYQFKKFDCETYVSTVLALALSSNFQQFQENINHIRYTNNYPSFIERNHFASADWIPHNLQKHYIHPVSFKFLPSDNQKLSQLPVINMLINKKNWYAHLPPARIKIDDLTEPDRQKKLAELRSYSAYVKNPLVSLPYIPLSLLSYYLSQIPNGAIIFIIKPSFLLISHMGFAIRKNNILYLRAASTLYEKVTDLPLLRYLSHQPGVLGIAVYEAGA